MKKCFLVAFVLVLSGVAKAEPVFFECKSTRVVYSEGGSYDSSYEYEAVIDIDDESCMIESKSGYLEGGYPTVTCKYNPGEGGGFFSKATKGGKAIKINRKTLAFSY